MEQDFTTKPQDKFGAQKKITTCVINSSISVEEIVNFIYNYLSNKNENYYNFPANLLSCVDEF